MLTGDLSFAEIMLRVGCALVGWLLVFAHGLALAVVPAADCSPELWQSTGLLAGFGLVAAGLLGVGLRWRANLRWAAVPALLLMAYGLYVAVGLLPATLDSIPLCEVKTGVPAADAASATRSERGWVPLQLVTLIACGVQSARYWRPATD